MNVYYTDGSCSPNPGPGGFAVIKNDQPTVVGHELNSTNIRMEGCALIAALADASGDECLIYSDSEFWINVLTKWADGWAANNWHKKNGEIKNLDIVREVYESYKKSQAKLIWVRGHEGTANNELADVWANRARTRKLSGYLKPEEVDPVDL
jgi:ribonuclease HI